MIGGLTKEEKTAEAGKTSNQSENYDVESVIRVASCAWNAIHCLLASYEYDLYPSWLESRFTSLKDRINKMEKDNSFTKDSAIIKFCRSIAENNKLYEELKNLNNLAENFANEEFDSQLEKIITDFKLKNLEDKVGFLMLLKEERDLTAIQKAYRDEWSFYDLINDRDFKQTYIDKAVTESANKSFKEDIDKCIDLAEQGKKTASKYFERKDIELQAYYTETDNAHRVLNVNLINYNRSEPTRISDILQQEKNIKELNIYCNKKHGIYAHQKDKKRYYEFKEGACYKMKSTWPVKDEFGNVSICTMIMNVSSDGITEVLKFDGEDFVSSEEVLELIKQNNELYIQGLSLYDAVLEKDKAADVVPTANNNFQNESIAAYQDKEPEGELDPKVDADNSLPPSINSNASTQTEVASQQIETQTEVNLQHTGTQTEVASQQMDELILNNRMLSKENVELKQEMSNLKKEVVEFKREIEAGLQVINKKHHELIQENQRLQEKLETTQAEANQTIVKLEKQNSDSQDRFEKEEQKNTELQTELAQKNEELAGVLKELQGKAQELKGVYEEKGKLEEKLKIVNVEKKESEDKLKEFEKEIDQAAHIMKEKEQSISNLKYQILGLENEYKAQLESYEQEINKLKWEIGELENRYNEFKEHVASTVESMDREHEDEIKELEENCDALSDIIADKVLEIEDLKSALQNSEKEKEFFHGQVEELSEETVANKQKGFNDQFYTLTFNSESDNESYVPLEEERKSLNLLQKRGNGYKIGGIARE